jgi:acyl dehydratase
MALNMDAIGKPIGPMQRDYTWRDAVLYALGVGAGFSELDYCYEKELKVIPSFAIAMIFDFFFQAAATSGINLAGILHGEQELIFHNPMPTQGTLITTGSIVDHFDKGADKGALTVARSDTTLANGQKLFTSTITIFARLDGGFGGKDRPTRYVKFPDREPDFSVEASPSPDQPLLYRLSGDIFHLHVDPRICQAVRIRHAHHARAVHPRVCLPGPGRLTGAGPSRAGAPIGLPFFQDPLPGCSHQDPDLENGRRQGPLAHHQCRNRRGGHRQR